MFTIRRTAVLALLVCAAVSAASGAESIVGRFQPEDEVARAVVGLTGPARLNLNAVRIVDLAGRKGEDLVLTGSPTDMRSTLCATDA